METLQKEATTQFLHLIPTHIFQRIRSAERPFVPLWKEANRFMQLPLYAQENNGSAITPMTGNFRNPLEYKQSSEIDAPTNPGSHPGLKKL